MARRLARRNASRSGAEAGLHLLTDRIHDAGSTPTSGTNHLCFFFRSRWRVRPPSGRGMRGASLSLQQISVGAPAHLVRDRGHAPDRQARARYDGDILHIIKQYPGCNDAQVLAFLRARVHWFGRDTLIHNVFRPTLRTVHAAGRRLEIAGKIKVDQPQRPEGLRFYPNNPFWAAAWHS